VPKLTIRAENVCGSTSNFVLLGVEPKEAPEDAPPDTVLVDMTQEFHTVITIGASSIGAGETFHKEVELDYDLRSLQWVVPPANRNRFVLHQLQWGDHNLIKEPGRI
jgi:hypothetical protein